MTRSFAGAFCTSLVLLVAGCVVTLDEEQTDLVGVPPSEGFAPPADTLASVVESCDYEVLTQKHDLEVGRAFSLAFPQGVQWIFTHEPIDEIASSTATAANVADICRGELAHLLDESGRPAPLLALNDEEAAFNAESPERGVALFPLSGFVDGERGYVFYVKLSWEVEQPTRPIGVGVAELEFGGVAQRLEPGVYLEEPTLLWLLPQAFMGTGVLLHDDGLAYVYGCQATTNWRACVAARVPPGEVADPTSYRYYDGAGWSERIEYATPMNIGASQLAPLFVPALGRLMTFTGGGSSVALAPEPWGPFDNATAALFWDLKGIQNAFLHAANDTIDVSYLTAAHAGPLTLRFARLSLR